MQDLRDWLRKQEEVSAAIQERVNPFNIGKETQEGL
jgi:hypothetical protein